MAPIDDRTLTIEMVLHYGALERRGNGVGSGEQGGNRQFVCHTCIGQERPKNRWRDVRRRDDEVESSDAMRTIRPRVQLRENNAKERRFRRIIYISASNWGGAVRYYWPRVVYPSIRLINDYKSWGDVSIRNRAGIPFAFVYYYRIRKRRYPGGLSFARTYAPSHPPMYKNADQPV